MPRRKQPRWVRATPPVSMFKPAGVPARDLGRAVLRLDEYEAIRLADYEGLKQEEVAERLGISRPTVSRILTEARATIASALVEGMTLVIEGGPVRFRSGMEPGMEPGGGRGHGRRRRRGHGGPPHG